MKQLEGKVAVVTGASKGIGAGIARALGEAGAAVVVNYVSDRDGAQRVVDAIAKAGSRAVAVQGTSPAPTTCAASSPRPARRSDDSTSS